MTFILNWFLDQYWLENAKKRFFLFRSTQHIVGTIGQGQVSLHHSVQQQIGSLNQDWYIFYIGEFTGPERKYGINFFKSGSNAVDSINIILFEEDECSTEDLNVILQKNCGLEVFYKSGNDYKYFQWHF